MLKSTYFIGPTITYQFVSKVKDENYAMFGGKADHFHFASAFTYTANLLTSTYLSGSLVQSHLICHVCSSLSPPQAPILFGRKARQIANCPKPPLEHLPLPPPAGDYPQLEGHHGTSRVGGLLGTWCLHPLKYNRVISQARKLLLVV